MHEKKKIPIPRPHCEVERSNSHSVSILPIAGLAYCLQRLERLSDLRSRLGALGLLRSPALAGPLWPPGEQPQLGSLGSAPSAGGRIWVGGGTLGWHP